MERIQRTTRNVPMTTVLHVENYMRYLEPLMSMSRWLGSLPYDRHLKATLLRMTLSFLALSASQIIVTYLFVMDKGDSMNLAGAFKVFCHLATGTIGYSNLYSLWKNRLFFSNLFLVLLKYELQILRLRNIRLWGVLFVFLLCHIPLNLIRVSVSWDRLLVQFLLFHGSLVSFSCILFFSTILEVCKIRVQQLKASLTQRSIPLLIKSLDEFTEIRTQTKKLSLAFSLQILIALSHYFTQIVGSLYFAFILSADIAQLLTWLLLASGSFFGVIIICKACEEFDFQAERFHRELFNLMCDREELCKNEKLRLCVSMGETVEFTACGFFNLGYPLVTSIIAAATTYLVILVQFNIQ